MRILHMDEIIYGKITTRTEAAEQHLRDFNRTHCNVCRDHLNTQYGCTDDCVETFEYMEEIRAPIPGRQFWYWHGVRGEEPTPETINLIYEDEIFSHGSYQLSCGHWWSSEPDVVDYIQRVHNRYKLYELGEFDEEVERARLREVARS